MITKNELYNIIENKIVNEAQKVLIRNIYPPVIAERMCSVIDGNENTTYLRRFLMERNNWIMNQQRILSSF